MSPTNIPGRFGKATQLDNVAFSTD